MWARLSVQDESCIENEIKSAEPAVDADAISGYKIEINWPKLQNKPTKELCQGLIYGLGLGERIPVRLPALFLASPQTVQEK